MEAQNDAKPTKTAAKTPAGVISVQLPFMSSAFDTAGWRVAA